MFDVATEVVVVEDVGRAGVGKGEVRRHPVCAAVDLLDEPTAAVAARVHEIEVVGVVVGDLGEMSGIEGQRERSTGGVGGGVDHADFPRSPRAAGVLVPALGEILVGDANHAGGFVVGDAGDESYVAFGVDRGDRPSTAVERGDAQIERAGRKVGDVGFGGVGVDE